MAGDTKEKSNSDEIWVNEFTEDSAQKFREKVLEAASEDPDKIIVVYIDSYGGYVDSLAKMVDTMNSVSNKFVTVAMGKAISCGAVLLSMGDARFCGKYSRVMVHRVSSMAWGDAFQMKSTSDETLRMNKQFMELLANNCGKSYDELESQIRASDGQEIWMDADAALKFGIADYVGLPRLTAKINWQCQIIPEKAPVVRKKSAKKSKKTKKPKAQ